MMKVRALLAAVPLAMIASAASANTITFNFAADVPTGFGSLTASAPSLTYTQGGLTLVVSEDGSGANATATQGTGLGVDGTTLEKSEALLFTFASNVTLNSIAFTLVDSGDDATVRVLSPNAQTLFDGALPTNGLVTLTGTTASRTGATVRISAPQGNDYFAIGAFTVDYTPSAAPPDTAAVPLPASAWSGLTLLGATALARRLRAKGST